MSFNPEDFLILARKLNRDVTDQRIEEAYYRTSIGRLYYFCYLLIRNWAINRGFIPENTAKDHGNLRSYLIANQRRTIGDQLRRLRLLRNDSDYKLEINITSKMNVKAIKIAESIKNNL
ncbi:MAG: hypothetical protein ACTSP4_12340 [Candidatus Hodarchaeales archaeon]